MMETPAQKLRKARIAKGFPHAADAARAYGWPASTYTSHENGTRGIQVEAARRYARAFGLDSGELLGLESGRPSILKTTEDLTIMGSTAIGIWKDTKIEEEPPREKLRGVPRTAPGRRQAVQVIDESVNRSIAPGEYAIYEEISVDPEHADGALLYIERSRDGLVERSIRRAFRLDPGRLKLIAHSTRPQFADPIEYPSSHGNEDITILGRVVGKYAAITAVE